MGKYESDKFKQKLNRDFLWITNVHDSSVSKELIQQVEFIINQQVLKALKEVKSKATNPPWASDSIQMVSLSAIEEIERLYK